MTASTTRREKSTQPPLIPEAVLKKRQADEERVRLEAAAPVPPNQKKSEKMVHQGGKKKRAIYVKKPETFVARARSQRHHDLRYRRVLKKGMQKRASDRPIVATQEITPPDQDDGAVVVTKTYQANSVGAPMVFCVRIRDHVGAPASVQRALHRLHLRQAHEGVFVRYDDRHRKLLHLIEPWVTYGPPSAAVVSDLITRRGFGRVQNQRVPLSDNTVIEQALGETCDILCVEDLVHELTAVGQHFDAVTKFLWPFLLVDAKTEFERRTLRQHDSKNDYGDRGQLIDAYIQQVL